MPTQQRRRKYPQQRNSLDGGPMGIQQATTGTIMISEATTLNSHNQNHHQNHEQQLLARHKPLQFDPQELRDYERLRQAIQNNIVKYQLCGQRQIAGFAQPNLNNLVLKSLKYRILEERKINNDTERKLERQVRQARVDWNKDDLQRNSDNAVSMYNVSSQSSSSTQNLPTTINNIENSLSNVKIGPTRGETQAKNYSEALKNGQINLNSFPPNFGMQNINHNNIMTTCGRNF